MKQQLLRLIGKRYGRVFARGRLFVLVAFLATGAASGGTPEYAIEPRFDGAGLFHEGMAPVKIEGLWGFIDRHGDFVIKPQYEEVLPGSGGRFGVRSTGRWGYVTTTGSIAIPPRFEEVRPFKDGAAAVRESGRWGYITPDGRFLRSPAFEQASAFDSGFSLVVKNGLGYVLPRSGETLLDYGEKGLVATNIGPPVNLPYGMEVRDLKVQDGSEGRAILIVNGKRYYVGENGQSYGPFDLARPFSEGRAAVRADSAHWFYVDKNGKFLGNAGFEGARELCGGLAPVALHGKWGFIDKHGRWELKPEYDQAYSFAEGYAVVRTGDKRGFLQIDGKGKIGVYVAPVFEDVFRFSEGLAPVKMNGKWGYLAARGQPQGSQLRDVVDVMP